MKQARLYSMTLLVACFVVTSSCSQNTETKNSITTDIFVGSTPCDSLIKTLLEIPSSLKCDFIKWELSFIKRVPATFQLTALYGESQPNTNGFIGGGKKIVLNGKYTVKPGSLANPGGNVYYLQDNNFPSPILLVEMDNNILHFADSAKNLIVGNGGYGYVLNRIRL